MNARVIRAALILAATTVGAACSDDDVTGVNTVPEALFTASATSVPAGDANQTIIILDASASSDADGDVLTFSWDVSGGTLVNGTTATDAIVEVTFPGDVAYVVTLTVSDGNGGESQASLTIDVV